MLLSRCQWARRMGSWISQGRGVSGWDMSRGMRRIGLIMGSVSFSPLYVWAFRLGEWWLMVMMTIDDIDLVKDMPICLQIVGGRFGEEKAVAVAKVVDSLMNS